MVVANQAEIIQRTCDALLKGTIDHVKDFLGSNYPFVCQPCMFDVAVNDSFDTAERAENSR